VRDLDVVDRAVLVLIAFGRVEPRSPSSYVYVSSCVTGIRGKSHHINIVGESKSEKKGKSGVAREEVKLSLGQLDNDVLLSYAHASTSLLALFFFIALVLVISSRLDAFAITMIAPSGDVGGGGQIVFFDRLELASRQGTAQIGTTRWSWMISSLAVRRMDELEQEETTLLPFARPR
jgi:hypothetical protein